MTHWLVVWLDYFCCLRSICVSVVVIVVVTDGGCVGPNWWHLFSQLLDVDCWCLCVCVRCCCLLRCRVWLTSSPPDLPPFPFAILRCSGCGWVECAPIDVRLAAAAAAADADPRRSPLDTREPPPTAIFGRRDARNAATHFSIIFM